MRLARPLWRWLAATLRVAALVVMVPVLAHAHAGHDHAGRSEPGHVHGLAVEAASRGVVAVAAVTEVQAGKAGADRSDCVGCPGCCCSHVFVAASEHDAARGDWPTGCRVAMGPDAAPPSAVPEALPEPPRPFA